VYKLKLFTFLLCTVVPYVAVVSADECYFTAVIISPSSSHACFGY